MKSAPNKTSLHIVGQGLAGTVLAWRCIEAGIPFTISEPSLPSRTTASKVAAGLVTPIAGQRLTLTENLEHLPAMERFYERAGKRLGKRFYHRRPVVRLLANQKDVDVWQQRQPQSEFKLDAKPISQSELPNQIQAPYDALIMQRSGCLQVASFIEHSRAYFDEHDLLTTKAWTAKQALSQDEDVITVFCTGPWLLKDQAFDWLPIRYTHGDLLTLRIPELAAAETHANRVYSSRCWLMRDGEHYRAGSTYHSNRTPETIPSKEGRAEIEQRLREFLKCPYKVVDHNAAVRPATLTRAPLLGRHPAHPEIAVFGGLGSKGVLAAPHLASLLIEHLMNGHPLPRQVDVSA